MARKTEAAPAAPAANQILRFTHGGKDTIITRFSAFVYHHARDAKGNRIPTKQFKEMLKKAGFDNPSQPWEITMPNGTVLTAYFGEAPDKAAPAPRTAQPTKAAARLVTAERREQRGRELRTLDEWKSNGSVGDKPETPILDEEAARKAATPAPEAATKTVATKTVARKTTAKRPARRTAAATKQLAAVETPAK